MVTTPRRAYVVGAATLWVPVYVLGFLAYGITMTLTQSVSRNPHHPPRSFFVLVGLHLFTMLLTFVLLAIYLVDVFHNADLAATQDRRTMWVVLLIVLNAFAMTVYWWTYLRPGGESFQRRQPAYVGSS
jgi:hypothetical protein